MSATNTPTKKATRPAEDHPVYWFAMLDNAVAKADGKTARQCREQLRRLGVSVSFSRPEPTTPADPTLTNINNVIAGDVVGGKVPTP